MTADHLAKLHELHQLKYRYIRALDTQQWDLMAECFTKDAEVWFGNGKFRQTGRDNIIALLRMMLTPDIVSSHLVMHPEIQLTSDDTASGIWRLQDIVLFTAPHPGYEHLNIRGGEIMSGAAYYHEEYAKQDGVWKITSLGYIRLYETVERSDTRDEWRLTIEASRGMKI